MNTIENCFSRYQAGLMEGSQVKNAVPEASVTDTELTRGNITILTCRVPIPPTSAPSPPQIALPVHPCVSKPDQHGDRGSWGHASVKIPTIQEQIKLYQFHIAIRAFSPVLRSIISSSLRTIRSPFHVGSQSTSLSPIEIHFENLKGWSC